VPETAPGGTGHMGGAVAVQRLPRLTRNVEGMFHVAGWGRP
jgi:hypothetical protein